MIKIQRKTIQKYSTGYEGKFLLLKGDIKTNPGDKGEQATEQAAQLQCYKLHV